MSLPANIIKAKQNRFTMSAKILADNGITVSVFNDPHQCPADYNIETKHLRLNEAHPNASNPVEALVYDRAKLFHELGHALFTKDVNRKRHALCEQSSNKNAFLDLSNILEDGRIERLLSELWSGSKDYLDAILAKEIETLASTPEMGLALYVRTGLFRNKSEEKYWKPYIKQIDHAVNGAKDCGEVCDIAFDICEKLYPPTPKQPQGEQPQDSGKGDSGKGDSDKGDSDKGDSDEGDSDEGDSDEGDSDEGNGHGSVSGELSDDIADKVKEITDKAKERVEDEAQSDYESIVEEAREMDDTTQEYADATEENVSDELGALFTSLLVEVSRVKFTPSQSGTLNTLALSSALTSRKCFQVREESLGAPFVALLIDTSGSQRHRQDELTKASRIIHGSLQKAKVNVRVIQYSDKAYVIPKIPVTAFIADGLTYAHSAMKLANDWLEEQEATRGLVIVITDGDPASENACLVEKQRSEEMNAYVLGIRVGYTPCALHDYQIELLNKQFHSSVDVPFAQDLPQAIEPHLETFLVGL